MASVNESSMPVSVPAMRAPPRQRDNPLTRSVAGMIGMGFLAAMLLACIASLPWTMGRVVEPGQSQSTGSQRYDLQVRTARQLPPGWWGVDAPRPNEPADADTQANRLAATARLLALERAAALRGNSTTVEQLETERYTPTPEELAKAKPFYVMGTDLLGRDLMVRCLAGGGVSLGIGIAAAALSVFLGTIYGAVSGYLGGRVDAFMMRLVDVLYGLPYVLLVVLLAVASDALMEEYISRQGARTALVNSGLAKELEKLNEPASRAGIERLAKARPELTARLEAEAASKLPAREVSQGERTAYDLITLLVAIGGVSWLTMARVVRGQVLSLKAQPFMEAARAMGVPVWGQFVRHLLPNLVGPITVYATLTVPQAILQESFLSFLGIGVKPPIPSWGNLAADGLVELNPFRSNWWLLLFPCLLLGSTLLALNFVGEGLREALDPKRARR